jgi:transposase
MEHLSSGMEQQQNQQLQWRRDKVQELCSKGYSQREISQTLQVGLATMYALKKMNDCIIK